MVKSHSQVLVQLASWNIFVVTSLSSFTRLQVGCCPPPQSTSHYIHTPCTLYLPVSAVALIELPNRLMWVPQLTPNFWSCPPAMLHVSGGVHVPTLGRGVPPTWQTTICHRCGQNRTDRGSCGGVVVHVWRAVTLDSTIVHVPYPMGYTWYSSLEMIDCHLSIE